MSKKIEAEEIAENHEKEILDNEKNETKELSKDEKKEIAKETLKNVAKKEGKFIKEFKEFALKGNVIDLAVGVLIGGAFQSVVTSLTKNIISPILGLFGGVNFSDYSLKIGKLNLYLSFKV